MKYDNFGNDIDKDKIATHLKSHKASHIDEDIFTPTNDYPSNHTTYNINNHYYINTHNTLRTPKATTNTDQNYFKMFLVCAIVGMLGIHKFLERKWGLGFLYFFTGGLFYFGWLYDTCKYFISWLKSCYIDK